jgi:hypothetical protein
MASKLVNLQETGLTIDDIVWDWCKNMTTGADVSIEEATLVERAEGWYILGNPNVIVDTDFKIHRSGDIHNYVVDVLSLPAAVDISGLALEESVQAITPMFIRDALKLAPSAGDPEENSIDDLIVNQLWDYIDDLNQTLQITLAIERISGNVDGTGTNTRSHFKVLPMQHFYGDYDINNFCKGMTLFFVMGNNFRIGRLVTDYNYATGYITVNEDFPYDIEATSFLMKLNMGKTVDDPLQASDPRLDNLDAKISEVSAEVDLSPVLTAVGSPLQAGDERLDNLDAKISEVSAEVDLTPVLTAVGSPLQTGDTRLNNLALIANIHDETFGRWVIDPIENTLTLYRSNGDMLQVFDLTKTTATVPAYIERMPKPT